jgi:hypothetical protein
MPSRGVSFIRLSPSYFAASYFTFGDRYSTNCCFFYHFLVPLALPNFTLPVYRLHRKTTAIFTMTYFTFNAANRQVSRAKIANSLDEEMDQMDASSVQAGLSIRNGPYEEMEVDGREENCIKLKGDGLGKRKARKSAENNRVYKEESSESDGDEPLVRRLPHDLHPTSSLF